MKRVIVLVAHGTVRDLDDLPEFLRRIRHGRPVPDSLISEMRERYAAIGGSPHLEETRAQALALQESTGLETRTAMRLWHPTVSEVTADLGPKDEVILVPLAPYSVAVYERAARDELSQRKDAPTLHCVGPWGKSSALIDAQIASIAEPLGMLAKERTEVILTAHSLPKAVIDAGDRYASEFESAAALVANALRGSATVTVAYQSQGAGGGAWLGPTLEDAMRSALSKGMSQVLVAPMGFLSEHIETLYDLDLEAKQQAQAMGLEFVRVPTLRCDPGLIETLRIAVEAVLNRESGGLGANLTPP